MNPAFWRGRRVLVTGHTGFKGTWLALMLESFGARVSGLALAPATRPSMFELLAPWHDPHYRDGDIRDPEVVRRALVDSRPEIVIHMAAMALVRPSYADPVGTFATNVMGTVNLLEAARALPDLRAVLAVTSDKVYDNRGDGRAFGEDEALGGRDPYSASKAACEMAVASYRHSFFAKGGPAIGVARAGNVVGGGDWSRDRLIPDVIRAIDAGRPVALRYPRAVRPWQHVVEALAGYLAMAERLAEAPAECPPALNFGPDPEGCLTVAEVVERISGEFGGRPGWRQDEVPPLPEAPHLTLDATRARRALGWRPRLDFAATIGWTAAWYKAQRDGADMRIFTRRQIDQYLEMPS